MLDFLIEALKICTNLHNQEGFELNLFFSVPTFKNSEIFEICSLLFYFLKK